MKKSGLASHVHHDKLFEYCHDYDERVRYIKESKPENEQKLRLKLFQLIPASQLPGLDSTEWDAYVKAGDAYGKTWDAYGKARDACGKARDACGKTWDVYLKAGDAYFKARDIYRKERDAYFKKYAKELEALHSKLCPDCPWDGKTIFTD